MPLQQHTPDRIVREASTPAINASGRHIRGNISRREHRGLYCFEVTSSGRLMSSIPRPSRVCQTARLPSSRTPRAHTRCGPSLKTSHALFPRSPEKREADSHERAAAARKRQLPCITEPPRSQALSLPRAFVGAACDCLGGPQVPLIASIEPSAAEWVDNVAECCTVASKPPECPA